MTADLVLREAARKYVLAAMATLETQRPAIEKATEGTRHWVRVSTDCFREQPREGCWWHDAIWLHGEKLQALAECREFGAAIAADSKLEPVVDSYVGNKRTARRIERREVLDGLIWALGARSGIGHFAEAEFDEEFAKWYERLTADKIVQVCLVPLTGFSSAIETIDLGDGVEISRFTDAEVAHLLLLGFFSEPQHRTLAWIKEVCGFRIVQRSARVVTRDAWQSDLDTDPWVQMNSIAERVLIALRVFKAQRVSSAGLAIYYDSWPLQASNLVGTLTDFPTIAGQRGLAYGLDSDESTIFPEFFEACERVRQGVPSVHLAMRRLTYAADRSRVEDQIIDTMIAAEALFLGGVDEGELTYRLALRGAYFLSPENGSRSQVQQFLKTAYRIRSSIAHGSTPKMKALRLLDGSPCEDSRSFAAELERVMRAALHKAIRQVSRTGKFNGEAEWNALVLGN